MIITLVHAYSTTNSGDGLLVDEAAELAREAFPYATINLIALDPASFEAEDFQTVLHPVTGDNLSPSNLNVLARGLLATVTRRENRSVARLRRDSDLLIAVGGGYLRAKNPIESLKTIAAHGPQLPSTDQIAIYLPQSIGPLRFATKRLVSRRLANAAAVHVRDDRSFDLLSHIDHVHRSPDLALLGLPNAWDPATVVASGRKIGVVARALPGSRIRRREYVSHLTELLTLLPDAELLIQAAARGNNDVAFYEDHLGRTDSIRTLKEAVHPKSLDRPNCIVSVRLHGSLESIRSGVPSVHLSYERKGWGAYDDLGLSPFVHNAYGFDAPQVAAQATALAKEADDYWGAVSQSAQRLTHNRVQLVEQLQRLAEIPVRH